MRAIILIITIVLAVGCGSEESQPESVQACAQSPLVGSWTRLEETLSFTAGCAVTSDVCALKATYFGADKSSDTASLTVTESSGSNGCLPTGQYSCEYTQSGSSLYVNCGGGILSYSAN